jgi:ABC-type antimicrobial peptide transport system permease subunit
VLRIVFLSTVASVTGGIVAGVALVFALNRIVASWVVGNAHDPAVLLGGTFILISVAGIACTLPALRASRVDPMTALRCE